MCTKYPHQIIKLGGVLLLMPQLPLSDTVDKPDILEAGGAGEAVKVPNRHRAPNWDLKNGVVYMADGTTTRECGQKYLDGCWVPC